MTSADDLCPVAEFAEAMSRTPQSTRWHREGDVLTHTRMVVDALQSLPEWEDLTALQREILTCAAWLHDIGKIRQTRAVGDDIEAPHHAAVGSRMARQALWLSKGLCGTPDKMLTREAIAQLVAYHSVPPHAIEMADARTRLHAIASVGILVPDFSIRMLCLLSRADMMGHISADRDEMLDNIALCEELAREEGCLDAPYPFPSPLVRRRFLVGADVWKGQDMYDDTWGPVVLMSGLPGTGKDTWIHQNLPSIPMISLDEIRRQRRIPPTKNQGLVANIAKDRAKAFLRRREPFVWNATNITEATRQQLIALFESYGASVSVVYLETDWRTLLARNSSRPDAVPPAAIRAMLAKLQPPEPHEAATVTWLTT